MALTELQRPSKTDFYHNLQSIASNMKNLMHRWKDASEFLANMTTTDLDDIGVPTGQIRTDLLDLRTVIDEMVDFFDGTATTQTKVPKTIVDKFRRMT